MKHIPLLALALVACGQEVSLDDRPCPCVAGWTCDAIRNVCVRGGGAAGPGAADAGADSTTGGQGSGSGSPDAGAGSGPPGWTFAPISVGDGSVATLQFSDAQHGFLAASDGTSRGLYVTADGGTTWQPRTLGVIPYGVGASPSLTTILAAGNGTQPVWSSIDHGASFSPVPWTLGGWPASVRFLDEQTVFMGDEVGDRVFRSADAGQTWAVHTFTRDVLPGTHAIESLGTSRAWIVGGPAFRGDGTGATIASSSDGAQSWTITTLTDRDHVGGSLHGVAVVSATELWVAGDNRQVFHTTDTMRTWTQLDNIPAEILHFGGVAVRGTTIVLAASISPDGYGLYRSTDGGATFQIIHRRDRSGAWDPHGVQGVTQTSDGDLFVHGYAGLLWRYAGVMLGGP